MPVSATRIDLCERYVAASRRNFNFTTDPTVLPVTEPAIIITGSALGHQSAIKRDITCSAKLNKTTIIPGTSTRPGSGRSINLRPTLQ